MVVRGVSSRFVSWFHSSELGTMTRTAQKIPRAARVDMTHSALVTTTQHSRPHRGWLHEDSLQNPCENHATFLMSIGKIRAPDAVGTYKAQQLAAEMVEQHTLQRQTRLDPLRKSRSLGLLFTYVSHLFLLSLCSCSCPWPSFLRVLTPAQDLEPLRFPRNLLLRNAARISCLNNLLRALR